VNNTTMLPELEKQGVEITKVDKSSFQEAVKSV
jgi:TRAP-type C4-dicarboxylate transport system substrate-binding protein